MLVAQGHHCAACMSVQDCASCLPGWGKLFPWDAQCSKTHALATQLWNTLAGLFTSILAKIGQIGSHRKGS